LENGPSSNYWLPLAKGHLHRRLFGDMLRRIWALPLHGVPTGNGLTEDLPRGSGAGRGVLGKCPGNQGFNRFQARLGLS
jgi:hypothetical protein